jgi:large subunit ribosomal protein L29
VIPLEPDEIRRMNKEELLKRIEDLRIELVQNRAKILRGSLKDVRAVRNTRKDIARILTALRSKGEGNI